MKKIILFFACCIAIGTLQAQGIEFAQGTWKEILAEPLARTSSFLWTPTPPGAALAK